MGTLIHTYNRTTANLHMGAVVYAARRIFNTAWHYFHAAGRNVYAARHIFHTARAVVDTAWL